MTTELNIKNTLDFSMQQIFSESYWEDYFILKNELGSNPPQLQKDNLNPLNPTYTLSFRSTEYSQEADFFRDAKGADQEIFDTGYAYGQISSMEKFYAELKATMVTEAANRYEIVDYKDNQAAGFSARLLKDYAINIKA